MTDHIDRLLAETQLGDDSELRDLLTELHRSATSVHPLPSAELSALMTPGRGRSSMRRRAGVVTALIVVGTLGVGVTAAAANPAIREAAQRAYQVVTGVVLPGTFGSTPGGDRGASNPSSSPSRSASASPHPGVTEHPQPSDHPGNGATNVATPHPSESHPAASDHPTPAPTGSPGKGRKP